MGQIAAILLDERKTNAVAVLAAPEDTLNYFWLVSSVVCLQLSLEHYSLDIAADLGLWDD